MILLAAAAGGVDAVSYLGLQEVFTAAMTGNTVLLGLAIGQGDFMAALASGLALVGFVVGVILVALAGQSEGDDASWPVGLTFALLIEALILAAIAVSWQWLGVKVEGVALVVLITATALAMGMQSAAVSRLNVSGVSTTYVTGTLVSVSTQLSMMIRQRWCARRRADEVQSTAQSASDSASASATGRLTEATRRSHALQLNVWLAYGIGAVVAGLTQSHWPADTAAIASATKLDWPCVALGVNVLLVMLVVIGATTAHLTTRSRA